MELVNGVSQHMNTEVLPRGALRHMNENDLDRSIQTQIVNLLFYQRFLFAGMVLRSIMYLINCCNQIADIFINSC